MYNKQIISFYIVVYIILYAVVIVHMMLHIMSIQQHWTNQVLIIYNDNTIAEFLIDMNFFIFQCLGMDNVIQMHILSFPSVRVIHCLMTFAGFCRIAFNDAFNYSCLIAFKS